MSKAANLQTVRNWNEQFPPGTTVLYLADNTKYKTFAWAGLDWRWTPAVFLTNGPAEPVPLSQLEVTGYTQSVVDKRKRPNARPSSDRKNK